MPLIFSSFPRRRESSGFMKYGSPLSWGWRSLRFILRDFQSRPKPMHFQCIVVQLLSTRLALKIWVSLVGSLISGLRLSSNLTIPPCTVINGALFFYGRVEHAEKQKKDDLNAVNRNEQLPVAALFVVYCPFSNMAYYTTSLSIYSRFQGVSLK